MGRWKDKYVIGLTGNIAMGKSLVRRMLEHLGAYTIDADGLAHQVMAPGAPAYQPVVDMFGKFVVMPDGQIDRIRLGAIAFSHPDALKELEKITHPSISGAIDTLVSRSKHRVVVVEAIKLLEGELAQGVDAIWVVDTKPEEQIKRLVTKRGLSEIEAKKRISVQNPQAEKIAKASVVINNNGTPEDTWAQVQGEWGKISGIEEDTAAVQAVHTVQVVHPPAPPPPPAPTTQAAPAPAPTPSPAPPVPPTPISSFDIKRPRPVDFEKIAQLINQTTGSNLTRESIMGKFAEKTYILAEANNHAMGVIAFVVENLVTRVDEFVIGPAAPLAAVGKGLIEAMEKASIDLQSEVAFVFLPSQDTAQKEVFLAQEYKEMLAEEVRYPAWREAVNEFKPANTVLLSKRLRESLVLKPI